MKVLAIGKIEVNGRSYTSGQEIDPRDAAAAIERGWARTSAEPQDGQSHTRKRERSQATENKALPGAPERK